MKAKIGELTSIRTGKLDANAACPDGRYPFFTCSKKPLQISTYSYDCECVLVAGNGDLNVKYYKGKFDAYQRTYIIEDNSGGKLYMPFLYFFMEGYIDVLRKQAIGGVIKYIKLGNLTEAIIELPSYEEQKEVVEILDKLKGIIDNETERIGPYLTDQEGNPLVPEIENGYYRLIDRQVKEGWATGADILHRGSFNFTLGLYDADAELLYFCELDT